MNLWRHVTVFLLGFLVLTPPTYATGLNASHFDLSDDLTGYGDAVLAGGNTRYAPDLDLNPNGRGQDPSLNCLQNESLDEIFLKITFKAGVTPDISKLVEIRYGNEFVFTPSAQKFYSRVVGQDLLVWYGLQDRADFGQTTVLTDSQWTFTVTGNHPVASVYIFIAYHSNTATEMPDLLPLNANHLYLLPDQTSQLYTETTSGHPLGKPLVSAQKLIVLVHGWNPQGYLNKFAPDGNGALSGRWAQLASTLVANPIVQQFGWTIARYDWSRDADTGQLHPWQSADAAMAHGAKLGQLVRNTGATQVQFIAHSAGNWAARRAAAYLKLKNPAIQIQITSLDPFVTGSLQPAYELTSLWTDYRDNIYVVDSTDVDTAIGGLGWTSGDFASWNNANIEYQALYQSWMKDHSGPVSWYGDTSDEVYLGNFDLLSANVGFLASLPVRQASAVNDNFPGQLLVGDSGSVNWLNYQATAQPSEPAHDPLTHAWRSVWGRWTALASGTVTFDTFGGDFYDVLAAYTGSSVASLTQIAHDYSGGKGPGQCQLSFPAVAGQTYYLALDGVLGQAGQSPLHWQMSGSSSAATLSLTAPVAGATVSNVTTVSASAVGATKVEFYLDGVRQFSDAATPFAWAWNTATAANTSHTLSAKSYSGTVLLASSANRTVTVTNSGTPPPGCADASEPNDSSLTATPLPPGASLNGYICSPTDVDWFRVTVTNSGTITFTLTVPAQNDYELEIYGPDYSFLKGSYQDMGQAESVTVSVTSPGTYYALVYGYPAGHGSFNADQVYTFSSFFPSIGVSHSAAGTLVSWQRPTLPYLPPGARFTAIAAYGGCRLALKSDGTVFAWGAIALQPKVPVALTSVGAIAAGGSHSLALTIDKTVVAWGDNSSSQCSVPTNLNSVGAIAAGASHSLALKSDGTVVAWGNNSSSQCLVPTNLNSVVAIAAGASHSLALRNDGKVVAWGNNSYNQCSVPTNLNSVVAIAVGSYHSVALRKDGTVVAWGRYADGQTTVPFGLNNAVAIAAGSSHSLALRSDGTVMAWGLNDAGQASVPDGLTGVVAIAGGADDSLALKLDGTILHWGSMAGGSRSSSNCFLLPTDLTGVVAVSAGTSENCDSFTLALKNDGTVMAWGPNSYGKATVPTNLTSVVAVSAGGQHSLALRSDGTVVAWGGNVDITGFIAMGQCMVPAGLNNVVAIAAGLYHSLALRKDGRVVAWGNDRSGQCSVPAELTNVVAIAAGYWHSMALKTDGTVVAWGENGGAGQSLVPAGLDNVVAIAAGQYHSVALRSDGSVVAWGSGAASVVPFEFNNVIAIAACGSSNLALKRDGTVVHWGGGISSQTDVSSNLVGVVAIATGCSHDLLIVADGQTNATPAIQIQPVSQVVSLSQSPSLAVSVNGTPPFTYQWLHCGTNLAGANAATLTLADAQPAQAGTYTVQVTGPGGMVTSAPATISFLTDANGNGLPDSWESDHGLALNAPDNATADPDHDGASNMQEYLAGTDPQSAASVFRTAAAHTNGPGFQITFTTVIGKTYRVEWASNPSGPWTVLENNLLGSGAPLQITDTTSPASASRFYRVRTWTATTL